MNIVKQSDLPGVYFFEIPKHEDHRGWLMELFRTDELEFVPQMAYVSQTLPDVMRGPHEHHKQTDFFVFMGPGDFELYLWSQLPGVKVNVNNPHETHQVGESNPRAVVVPPGIIHAYRCVSEQAGLVFNAPNALYGGPGKMYPVDEIRHEDE